MQLTEKQKGDSGSPLTPFLDKLCMFCYYVEHTELIKLSNIVKGKGIMKTYNIEPEQLKLSDFEITGIALGERGRGRQLTIVPTPKEGYMKPGLSKSGKPRLDPTSSSDGWLARVRTKGTYIRGACGNISVHPEYAESVKVVSRGHGAFGDAGRTGTWDDLIISGPDEFILRVKPTRGDAYLLFFTAEKVVEIQYPEADALDIDTVGSTPTTRGGFIRL